MSDYKPTLQSAFYLMGNKRKLMPDILPHLEGRKVLVDVFSGSGTVALNAISNFKLERVICNDIMEQMVAMHKDLQNRPDWIEACEVIDDLVPKDKQGYLNLREAYNKHRKTEQLYNLMMRSNNNMIRFNGKGENNMPFGERHRFDKDRLVKHKEIMQDVEWSMYSFGFLLSKITRMLEESGHKPEDTVVYLDPPYLITNAVYNEKNGWTEDEDRILMEYMIDLQKEGYKVVYSNVMHNRQRSNTPLIQWAEDNEDIFQTYHLNMDYNNSNANKGTGKTDEVLIVSK